LSVYGKGKVKKSEGIGQKKSATFLAAPFIEKYKLNTKLDTKHLK
jgi:uncharacterized protein YbbC (DUF1343 family)